MIYLPSALLKPGMVLARNVTSSNSRVPLLVAGQGLTEASIGAISNRGIKGLYVEYHLSDDVAAEELLDPEMKQALLTEIKAEFQKAERPNMKMNYQSVSKLAETMVMSVLTQTTMLFNVMDIRDYDNYTYSHSLYVGMMGAIIGSSLKLKSERMKELATAGLLHDIGKLEISTDIINKPGTLTAAEAAIMREHPARGVQRLRAIPSCKEAIIHGVSSHHEYMDGSGYPQGLSGKEIPLYGRILSIADVYDALSSKRSYREAWSQIEIIDYITSRSGYQFDQSVVQTFLKSVIVFPAGSLVRLSDGSVGIVIKNHAGLTLRPSVRFLSPPERVGYEIDLSVEALDITVVGTIKSAEALNLPPP